MQPQNRHLHCFHDVVRRNSVFAQRSPTPIVQPNMPTGVTKDTASAGNQTPPSQPPSKKENQAIKAFRETPANDPDKSFKLGENFLQTYPQSRYRIEVIATGK
jgi:hypothetical protein